MDCIARRHTQTSDADRQVNSTLAKFGNSGIYVAAEGLREILPSYCMVKEPGNSDIYTPNYHGGRCDWQPVICPGRKDNWICSRAVGRRVGLPFRVRWPPSLKASARSAPSTPRRG